MPLFTVNKELCQKDGMCAAECPAFIITLESEDGFPVPVKERVASCINCGHCVAVCPHGALSLATMPSEACASIRGEMLPKAENLDQLIRARRSIRSYKEDPLPSELIEALIDTARYAPTGSNSQQISWSVSRTRDKTKDIAGMVVQWMESIKGSKHPLAKGYNLDPIIGAWKAGFDVVLRGAPALVVAHAPAVSGSTDCTIAMATLELAAFSRGVGTCWAGFFMLAAADSEEIRDAIGIPKDSAPGAAMMLGYQKFAYSRVPLRKQPDITWIK